VERFGFVGLPNAGKSSLYNALTGGSALAAPYAFATVDPNVGVAKVFDDRIDRLAEMAKARRTVHASVQFTDIGGLVEGAHKGEGLGNRFLAGIREVDAIVYVLRAHIDPDVPGPTDPLDALAVLEIELALGDLDSAEKQLDKRRRAGKSGDKSADEEVGVLEAAVASLEQGVPIYRSGLNAEQRELLKPIYLLTNKPVMAVVNIGEDQLSDVEAVVAPIRSTLAGVASADAGDDIAIGAWIQLEAEAAQLDEVDRQEMLDAYDLGEGALPRFLRTAYHVLGLRTYFTVGEKEARAWTFRAGAKAPECAGVIHSDFQRGFIRAETIRWDELLAAGSWPAAREQGKVRSEGKEYVAQDGDVMEFRFNV
jgi:GTP-binding protein YchF